LNRGYLSRSVINTLSSVEGSERQRRDDRPIEYAGKSKPRQLSRISSNSLRVAYVEYSLGRALGIAGAGGSPATMHAVLASHSPGWTAANRLPPISSPAATDASTAAALHRVIVAASKMSAAAV
jgi:hypothetical protein